MELLIRTFPSGLTVGATYAIGAVGLALIWGVLHMMVIAHGTILVIGVFSGIFIVPKKGRIAGFVALAVGRLRTLRGGLCGPSVPARSTG